MDAGKEIFNVGEVGGGRHARVSYLGAACLRFTHIGLHV
jgi:hypothetical protein